MKNYYIILLVIFMFSCEQDGADSFSQTDMASESSGTGGSLARMIINEGYLYSVDRENLHVFSLINPENPVQVQSVPIGFNIETIFSIKQYLFMGSEFGMYIYDVSSPENPTYVSEAQHFRSCDPVVSNLEHAFVTLYSDNVCGGGLNELQVYDIDDIYNPILIHSRNLVNPIGLGLYGNYLFVCDDIVKIFDVSNIEDIQLVHSIDKSAFDLILKNNRLYLIGDNGLYQYQLDNQEITNILELSTLNF